MDTFLNFVPSQVSDPEVLVGVDIQYPNGKDWSVDGPFGIRRNATTLSPDNAW